MRSTPTFEFAEREIMRRLLLSALNEELMRRGFMVVAERGRVCLACCGICGQCWQDMGPGYRPGTTQIDPASTIFRHRCGAGHQERVDVTVRA